MATLSGDDKLMAHLNEMVQKLDAGTLSVGFMSGAKYPDGTPVAQVAFYNEFGTKDIPTRPFFRKMIADESGTWGPKLAKLLAKDFEGEKALNSLGMDISGALEESIVGWTTPANAPSTIAKKGFDKPLIDTGHMKSSITHKVD